MVVVQRVSAAGSAFSASSWPGVSFSKAASVGANTTYGPFSSTGTTLTSGFSSPEIAAEKVLSDGILASA